MFVLIVIVAVTILVSSSCSLFESVLYTTRMGTLEASKSEGRRQRLAASMLEMKRNISGPIAAILILNTIANTAGATMAGAWADKVLGGGMVPLFSILFTFAILFFAEIFPKTAGAVFWRTLWPGIVRPLTAMRYLLSPLIWVTEKATSLITRGHKSQHITEKEILAVIRWGETEGEISNLESLIVHNIIGLEDKQVEDIMTPRTVMFSLPETALVEDVREEASEKGFTRIPLYRDDRERITGYVMIHDLNSHKACSAQGVTLAGLARPMGFVDQGTNCLKLLARFLRTRRHVSVVKDPYGGVAGLVTLEDLLETMLGTEIVDERDEVADLQKLARRKMRRGSADKDRENR